MREQPKCPFHHQTGIPPSPEQLASNTAPSTAPSPAVDQQPDVIREVADIHYGPSLLSPMSTFSANPLSVLNWVREEYGSAARFTSPLGTDYFVLSDPVAVDSVLKLTDKPRFDPFDKSKLLIEGAGWIIGHDNIIVSSNEEWREQRKMVSGFLGRSRFEQPAEVADIVSAIQKTASELSERIDASTNGSCVVELQHEMSVLTLRVTMDSTFGIPDTPREQLEDFVNAARVVHSVFPIETLVPGDIPFDKATWFSKRAREITHSKKVVLDFCKDIIETSRAEANLSRPTFVSRMLSIPGIDEEFVLHNVITMIFAGHETSGNALSSTIANIALDPEKHQAVLDEVLAVPLAERTGLKDIYSHFPRLQGTIEENLRMYPPVFLLMRETTQNVRIETREGYIDLPEGSEIFLDIFGSQRNEGVWGEQKTGFRASEYHPARWSEANKQAQGLEPGDMNLQCFGGGSRICAGLHSFFATALAAGDVYLGEFTFEPLFESLEGSLVSDFSLQHEGGLHVIARKRPPVQ